MSIKRIEGYVTALKLVEFGATRRLLENYYGKTREVKSMVVNAEIGRPKTSSVWLQNSVVHTMHANILWGLFSRINKTMAKGTFTEISKEDLVSVYKSYLLFVDTPLIDINQAYLVFKFLAVQELQSKICTTCGETFISHYMAMSSSCPFCRQMTRYNKKDSIEQQLHA